MFRRIILAAGLLVASLPAWAAGPGEYVAQGETYQGMVTVTQTGKGTWRFNWIIGNERYEGYGVGDANVIAISFTSRAGSGTGLYVANSSGGYDGIWANRSDRAVSGEVLTPR